MRWGRRPGGADVHPDDLEVHDRSLQDAELPDDVEDTIRLGDLPWGRSGVAVPAASPADRPSSSHQDEPAGTIAPPVGETARDAERDVETDSRPDAQPDSEPTERIDMLGEAHAARPSAPARAADPTVGPDSTAPTDAVVREEPEPAPVPEPEPEPRPADMPAAGTWAPRDVAPTAAVVGGPSTGATSVEADADARTSHARGDGSVLQGTASGGPQVAKARRRFVRRRWARRWGVWRRVVAGLVVLALVLAGVWLVFLSSVLAVSGVQVTGNQRLSSETVRRAAAVPLGGPLATVDLDAVTARLERVPAVRSVDVSRAWPDRVRVDVTERTVVAVTTSGGDLRGVDATGVVFGRYAKRPAGMPLIRRTPTTDRDALAEAATVAGSLPPDLSRRVAYVSVATVDRISLGLRSGRSVQWGSAADSADKARVLLALLPQKAATYDVSVPGQPVIKK